MEFNLNKIKKSVSFDLTKNKIKVLYVYNFAMQSSRNGKNWIILSVDRVRFKKRVDILEKVLITVLNTSHRLKVYNQRFLMK